MREFDILIWGATGFTGKLVAEYLSTHPERKDIAWALGGRSKERLEAVRSELAAAAPSLQQLELVVADALDDDDIDAVAGRARVIATAVGPYHRYGMPLAQACARRGTHYCDLNGEVHFVRACADALQKRARDSGARIVNCCGFDAVPSDVGVWLLQKVAIERYGATCKAVRTYVERFDGRLSGGSISSTVSIMEALRDKELREVYYDPYSLIPAGSPRGPDRRDQLSTRWDAERNTWTAPFVMQAINGRIVRRSHAMLGLPWGREFSYAECRATGSGIAGWLRAQRVSAGLKALLMGLAITPLQRILLHYLPSPGEGPSRAEREASGFRMLLHGTGGTPEPVTVLVESSLDPGYGTTAVIFAEAALCLARDDLEGQGGVLTPSVAMAEPLLQRIRNAGITFEAADS